MYILFQFNWPKIATLPPTGVGKSQPHRKISLFTTLQVCEFLDWTHDSAPRLIRHILSVFFFFFFWKCNISDGGVYSSMTGDGKSNRKSAVKHGLRHRARFIRKLPPKRTSEADDFSWEPSVENAPSGSGGPTRLCGDSIEPQIIFNRAASGNTASPYRPWRVITLTDDYFGPNKWHSSQWRAGARYGRRRRMCT